MRTPITTSSGAVPPPPSVRHRLALLLTASLLLACGAVWTPALAQTPAVDVLYPPSCVSQAGNVAKLLAAPDDGLEQAFTDIPNGGLYCRADALAQAMLEAEAAGRPRRADALREIMLRCDMACDPGPHYAAARVALRRGDAQVAACFLDKARSLAGKPEAKERLRREYAALVAKLPAAPLDQLACSRLVGATIKQRCERKRGTKNVDVDEAAGGIAGMKVEFDTDQDTLRPDGAETLRRVVAALQGGGAPVGAEMANLNRSAGISATRPGGAAAVAAPVAAAAPAAIHAIHLVGHADARGSDEHNLDLSRRRAETVRRDLAAALPGVAITSEGRGKRELLILDAQLESEHQMNRRVEIRVR